MSTLDAKMQCKNSRHIRLFFMIHLARHDLGRKEKQFLVEKNKDNQIVKTRVLR